MLGLGLLRGERGAGVTAGTFVIHPDVERIVICDIEPLVPRVVTPMFGEQPIELGLREGDGFLPMLRSDTRYHLLFEHAFPAETQAFTVQNVVAAVACFERSIISARSPYDRYHYGGDDHAVPASANSSHAAARTMFCVTTTAMALIPVSPAIT